MKKYYGYGETSYKGSWDYFKGFKYPSFKESSFNKNVDFGTINIRYVSYCNKKDIINTVGELINNKNWIRQRIAETGNNFEINLAEKYPEQIVVYITEGKLRNTIIALIDIKPGDLRNGKLESDNKN